MFSCFKIKINHLFALDETKWCLSEQQRIKTRYKFKKKAEIDLRISWKRVLRRNFYCNQQKPVAFFLFGYSNVPHLICPTWLLPYYCHAMCCAVLCCTVMSIATSSRRKSHSIRLAEPLSKTLDLKQWHMYLCKCY